jgi:hypothetical protein
MDLFFTFILFLQGLVSKILGPSAAQGRAATPYSSKGTQESHAME